MQSAYFVLYLPLSLPLLIAGPGTFFEGILPALRVSFRLAGMSWNDNRSVGEVFVLRGRDESGGYEQTLRLTFTTVVQSTVSS